MPFRNQVFLTYLFLGIGCFANTSTTNGDEPVPGPQFAPAGSVVLCGRLLKEGKPLPNVVIKALRQTEGVIPLKLWATTKTDEFGRYEVKGMKYDEWFNIVFEAPEDLCVLNWSENRNLDVKNYEYNVGKVSVRDGVEQLPDSVAVEVQVLRGIVVDFDGNPLAGIELYPTPQSLVRKIFSRFPRTKTDAFGRFEFRNLPRNPLVIVASWPHRNGEPRRPPTQIRTSINQQNIRLALDPDLAEDLEDLDAMDTDANKRQQ